jgi:hypothetical protein
MLWILISMTKFEGKRNFGQLCHDSTVKSQPLKKCIYYKELKKGSQLSSILRHLFSNYFTLILICKKNQIIHLFNLHPTIMA